MGQLTGTAWQRSTDSYTKTGRTQVILQCDDETSTQAVSKNRFAKQRMESQGEFHRQVLHKVMVRGKVAPNAIQPNAITSFSIGKRTFQSSWTEFPVTQPVMPWMAKRATWHLNRFLLNADGLFYISNMIRTRSNGRICRIRRSNILQIAWTYMMWQKACFNSQKRYVDENHTAKSTSLQLHMVSWMLKQ